jgi:hypothetical protein
MLGFLIGTVCLVGLVKVLRRGHGWHGGWRWGYAGCGGGGCGRAMDGGSGRAMGRGGFHDDGDEWGPRFSRRRPRGTFLRAIFERLDTTPGQEKFVAAAIDEVREAGRRLRGELSKSREDLAQAVRAEHFDAESLGLVFARHDEAIESMRKAFVGALAKVHDALDERQRARLADVLASGGSFRGFGGPYRGFA